MLPPKRPDFFSSRVDAWNSIGKKGNFQPTGTCCRAGNRFQRVLQVGDQIVRILNANREPDHLLRYANPPPFFGWNRQVRG